VPLPWAGAEPPFGFSLGSFGAAAEPWLPQPKEWRDLTVEAETGKPGSMLELYRAALALRRAEPGLRDGLGGGLGDGLGGGLGDGPMTWLPGSDGVLAFDRGSVRCVVNISAAAVRLPEHAGLLLASGPLEGELLPPDTAVWLRAGQ